MLKKLAQKGRLVWLVEDSKNTYIVFWLWGVLKVLDIITYDLAVSDEEALAINDVRNHHYLVKGAIRKFKR